MAAPIIVVGHRNPDNDSISAAVGYAYLKNELAKRDAKKSGGKPAEYIPMRLGPMPPESAWVLGENSLQTPAVLSHIHARVLDIMSPNPISISRTATLLEAGRLE
ncbi:MAG: DHH family phosphoesterase [Raoultibacter sp.]